MTKLSWTCMVLLFSTLLSFGQLTEWERSMEKVYEEGKVLYDQQMYAAAVERFEEVIDQAPHEKVDVVERSAFYRAMCALKLMNRDAQDRVREFMEHHPTSAFRYDILWSAADYTFNQRDYDDALEWLGEMDVREMRENDRATYYFKKGYSHFMEDQSAEAKAAFREIKDGQSSLSPSAKYYYAHLNYADSNYVTALREFEGLREDPSFGPMVPYYLAQIYYQTGQDEELLEIGNELLNNATASRSAEIAKLVGQAMFRQKRYEEALPYMELYVERGGAMRQKEHYQMGVALHAVERYRDAMESLNKVTASNRELAQTAFYLLADCYLKVGEKNEALSAFKATMEASGDPIMVKEAHYNYALLSYELANPFDDAIDALKSFQEAYPNSEHDAEINQLLANLYITTKDYDKALQAISATGLRTVVMREAYQKVAYYRGVELYNALQWGKAAESFSNSLKYPINSTTTAMANYWLGEIHYRRKDYASARESFTTFQEQTGAYGMSEFPISQYNVAYCYFMEGNYGQAATTFRLFVDSRRSDANRKMDATLRLADSYFMERKYQQAIGYYSNYVDQSGREADYASFQRALSYGLSSQDEKKVTELRRIIQSYPNSHLVVDARYELGASLLRMDQNAEALQVFNRFRELYPQSVQSRRALLQIGVIHRNMGNYEASIQSFNELVEQYPSTDEAREAISFARLVYDRAGRIDDYVDWVEGISFADVQRASLDSTVYTSAYEKYGLGSCVDAIPAFETYLERFPDGIFVIKANYTLAGCALQENDPERAKKAYEAVIAAPVNDYTEASYLQLGHLAMADRKFNDALNYYGEVVQTAQSSERYRSASVGRMRAAAELKLWERAVNFAEIVQSDPGLDQQVRNESRLIQARGLWATGKQEESRRVYVVLRDSARGEARAEASYHVAQWHSDEGQYEESNAEVFWMVEELPVYKKWRFESLLVLAKNYWKMEDIFQAQYTLDFIIDENYNEDVVRRARVMKEQIALDQARKEAGAGADTTEIEIKLDGVEEVDPIETDEQ